MTTLAEQIAALESRLAAYESRKVPLSIGTAARIFWDHPEDDSESSALAVARAALVAAESPAAVKAGLAAWNGCIAHSDEHIVSNIIRAAHDAAIDGGCGAARESAGPPWLADAAEALGKRGAALNWSQVISEIRELRHRFDTEVEHHKLTVKDCDKWLDEAKRLEKERDAYEKAKTENDDRFMGERDDARRERDMWQANASAHRAEVERAYKERDDLRRQLDALTRPIDGVEELGRIGWKAWIGVQGAVRDEDKIHADERCAQAIASRVIGALRIAMARGYGPSYLRAFDAAVASLKIEPAKVEATPKREPFELPHYGLSFGVDDCVAIRDRIREIERRLEAGGL